MRDALAATTQRNAMVLFGTALASALGSILACLCATASATRLVGVLGGSLLGIAAGTGGVIVLMRANRLERHHARLQSRRQHASEIEHDQSELLGNVNHALRTPMNAIIGFAQLLGARTDNARDRGYVDAILLSSRNLLSTVGAMLEHARLRSGALDVVQEVVDIDAMLRALAQESASTHAGGAIELIHRASALPATVLIDRRRICHALGELLRHVATIESGRQITLATVASAGTDTAHVRLVFSVGANPSPIGSRVERGREGFGDAAGAATRAESTAVASLSADANEVRLASVQRLLDPIGGVLRRATTTHGIEHRIELPAVELVASTLANAAAVLAPIARVSVEKILVVDDVPLNRELLVNILESYAHHIVLAADGEQAVELALAERPELILMDVRMPRLDGPGALKKLRQHAELDATPVIAVTASHLAAEEIALREQFDGFVRKPIVVEALAAEMARVLAQKYTPSPPVAPLQPIAADPTTPSMPPHELAALLEQLEQLRGDGWTIARGTLAHTDVVAFIDTLLQSLVAVDLPELLAYGLRLRAATLRFDILVMEQELDRFPTLVDQLHSLNSGA